MGYNRALGEWLSRDPIAENGGKNLYAFTANGPVNEVDSLGLCCRVKEFRVLSARWQIGEDEHGYHSLSLYIDFFLSVTPDSNIKDCRVRQWMRGRVSSGVGTQIFPKWTQDGPKWWWDGEKWAAGRGMSSRGWVGHSVVFHDAPGFDALKSSEFPIFWGGLNTPADFFDFETQVVDITFHPEYDGITVGRLNWGMWMSGDNPSSVAKRYYFQQGNGVEDLSYAGLSNDSCCTR